jgi:predicted RNA-binding Zn ribbon-like protein
MVVTAMAAHWNDPAPGDLALVQRFVNTLDLESETDELADPERLAAWLRSSGLGAGDVALDEAAHRRVVEFREALRGVLLAHNGAALDPGAIATLDAAARDAPVRVAFAADGTARLAGGGVVGELLAIIARAQAEGTWPRLKACPADGCMWAFYDRSRNRSRTWCSMSVCGNRAKARSYRARRVTRGG